MSDWSSAYKLYRPEILTFLRRRLWGKGEVAEDLCQETFARAIGAGRLREPDKVRAYLFRTANNLLINHIQRAGGVVGGNEVEATETAEREDTRAANPHRVAEGAQLLNKVQELLAGLPDDQRIAFEHGVVEHRPYAEIAEEQSWSITKVKICVYRARKRLMAGLKEYR